MNRLEKHRRDVTAFNRANGFTGAHGRKEKRLFRRHYADLPLLEAFAQGDHDGVFGMCRPGLYPPGKRLSEYLRGYQCGCDYSDYPAPY